MRALSVVTVAGMAFAAVMLSGCGAEPTGGDKHDPPMITSEQVAKTVAGSGERLFATGSDVDCGQWERRADNVGEVMCLAVDPASGEEVQLKVFVSGIDNWKGWRVDVSPWASESEATPSP